MEATPKKKPQKMVSLFAGIGGFELAFQKIGVKTTLVCEIDSIAQHILRRQIPQAKITSDICELSDIPNDTDILCAGFPCQDLSSVGAKAGLNGTRSSLVREVFRLLQTQKVECVIFENVSFMLSLNGGEAIRTIVSELEELGYSWAYRTVDSISFLPQHRCRVFVVASLHNDPRDVILSEDYKQRIGKVNFDSFDKPIGFYWTEGKNALGVIEDGLPTLKAGSTIGIASPPAIAFPNGEVSVPDIRDAERLQGFPANWTLPAEEIAKASIRWKLVGNAVTVNTVAWIANKLINPVSYDSSKDKELVIEENGKWPNAAWGGEGKRYVSLASKYPTSGHGVSLTSFLKYPCKPLSLKASKGFEKRLLEGRMRYPDYFRRTIHQYIKSLEEQNNG